MRMIRPQLAAPQISVAENQEEFKTLTVALVRNPHYDAVKTEHGPLNTVVMAFQPNDEERARIAAGEAIYVQLLTFLRPQPGIVVSAGADEVCAMYGVTREEPTR